MGESGGKDEHGGQDRILFGSGAPIRPLQPAINTVLGSGIDDSIWFKFKTDTVDLREIFAGKVVDISEFKSDFTFGHGMTELKWWDVKGKSLLGGQVSLPNVRFMNVGIEKIHDGYVVYIMWHEV